MTMTSLDWLREGLVEIFGKDGERGGQNAGEMGDGDGSLWGFGST